MKKYILTGIALLLINATASENPFDLKENFALIEEDQEVLLSDLKKIAKIKESAEDEALEKEEEPKPVAEEKSVPALPVIEIDDIVSPSDERLNKMREKALEKSKQEALKKAIEAKEKELEQAKEEERIAQAKKEAEKREVEAYEKKRAQRLAQKEAEKEALDQKIAQEREKKEEALKQKKLAKKTEVVEPEKKGVDHIDIAREKEEAKIAADKAYEDAVHKMSQEETIGNAEEIAPIKNVSDESKYKVVAKKDVQNNDISREKEEAKTAADKAYEEAIKEMDQEESIAS